MPKHGTPENTRSKPRNDAGIPPFFTMHVKVTEAIATINKVLPYTFKKNKGLARSVAEAEAKKNSSLDSAILTVKYYIHAVDMLGNYVGRGLANDALLNVVQPQQFFTVIQLFQVGLSQVDGYEKDAAALRYYIDKCCV